MTDRNFPSVCVEKLHPFESYRVSAGPDTGYGASLGVFEDAQAAREYAHELSDEVFLSVPVRRDLGLEICSRRPTE